MIRIVIGAIPNDVHTLEVDVVNAVNAALRRAQRWLDEGISQVPGKTPPTLVSFGDLCLYACGTLQIADHVQLRRIDGSSAAIANAGSGEINIGVEAQVGDIWSLGPVVLRDRCQVNGSIRTAGTVTRQNGTVVTGRIVEGDPPLLPTLDLVVSFPAANQGPVSLEPGQQRVIAPGAYAAVSVKPSARLSLSAGSYYFDSLMLEPGSQVIVDNGGGRTILYVRRDFIFRGAFVPISGPRPDVVVACFGTNQLPIEAPFAGTLIAPDGLINLASVRAPGHSGAFFGKNVPVQPGNTVTAIPFSEPPSL